MTTNGNIPFELEFKLDELRKYTDLVKKVYGKAVSLLAQDLWANIGKEAPTDHGKLAGNWLIERMANEYDWRIYTMTKYALFVHEGTGVYGPRGDVIRPKSAKALSFEWKGKNYVVRYVRGQKPNPYVDRAMQRSQQRIHEFVLTAIDQSGAA